MFVVDSALNVIHSSVRHATAFEYLEPFFGRLSLKFVFDDSVKRISVLHSQRIGDEAGICLPLRLTDLVAQDTVQFVVTAAHRDVRVVSLIRPVRYH
jgi:hypothetical protein